MARPVTPKPVSEELAQLRNARQMIFYLAECIERRDKDLAAHLARVIAGQEEIRRGQQQLDLKLDQVVELFTQYSESSERDRLETMGHVVQGNEVIRHLTDVVHKAPVLTANATAVAVGAVLRPRPPRIRRYRPRPSEPLRLLAIGADELAA